jgi:Zn finger protein HypA/HybF involved in hydrogenase expression
VRRGGQSGGRDEILHRSTPLTLGGAATARVRLIVWCRRCRHQAEPDPAELAKRYGAATAALDWRDRLVCSQCGSRDVDIVVTGTERR